MDFVDFNVTKNDLDRRIDKVIRNFIPELQLSAVYKAIRKGLIKVNKKKISQDYRTQENDVINIAAFLINTPQKINDDSSSESVTSAKITLPEIVFQNQHILILNKPYDILVHGSSDSLDKQVLEFYKNTVNEKSLSFNPGPLHRLDRKTTGLIAFSMSLEGARWFTSNIKNHTITKTYAAILQGELKAPEEWKDYITRNNNKTGFKTVTSSSQKLSEDSDEAWTSVTPVAYGTCKNKKITLVKLIIHTGRTHQIRSQSSLHGYPLLGDTAYGGVKLENEKQDFYLQACRLEFGENPLELPEQLSIPLNKNFSSLLFNCGIEKTEL